MKEDNFFKVEAEIVNLPNLISKLESIKHFVETEKEINQGLKKSAQYLIRQGKKKLKDRMLSGSKGVTGNLLKSFTYKIKKNNAGVLVGFKRSGSHSWLVSEGTKKRNGTGQVVGNKYWSDTKQKDTNTAMYYVMQSIRQSISNIKNRYNVK